MKSARLLLTLLLLPLIGLAQAQKKILQSGPMVAWSDFRECAVWVQTTDPAHVQIRYREKGKTGPEYVTENAATDDNYANCVTLVADKVEPGRHYTYDVYINGKKIVLPYPTEFQSQALWRYRGDVPPDFTIAVGSCLYVNDSAYDRWDRGTRRPGKYGQGFNLLNELHKKRPDAMLWIGDNTYTREPDWNSMTGILHRYTHTRSFDTLQPLLASTHNYATWDDHDYGPNDGDRSYWGKHMTSAVFSAFFPMLNTGLAGPGSKTSTFFWGDAQFFLLDDRWFRAPNDDTTDHNRDYFGAAQLQWLRDALISSHAKFKIIASGGQILSTAAVYENYANYTGEYARFKKMLDEINVNGIFLLSGDRHFTELTKWDRKNGYPIYDLTTSPISSGSAGPAKDEVNANLVDGTIVLGQSAALLRFAGPNNDRSINISILKSDGSIAWTREIKYSEISKKR